MSRFHRSTIHFTLAVLVLLCIVETTVRAETEDGWWLLRASNTQPVVVARREARDAAGLARLKAEIRRHLVAASVDSEYLA